MLRTIAFPAISTGVYGFPAARAAKIALAAVSLNAGAVFFERIVFCCYSIDSAAHHLRAINELDRILA